MPTSWRLPDYYVYDTQMGRYLDTRDGQFYTLADALRREYGSGAGVTASGGTGGGWRRPGVGLGAGTTPTTGIPAGGWKRPGVSLGAAGSGASYFQNSMAPYNFTYPKEQPLGAGQGAPARGTWGGWGQAQQDMFWGTQNRLGMQDQGWNYGLTYDQMQEGYVPGASELNAYGQPLGTVAPYNSAGMSHRRQNRFASQAQPGAQPGDRWQSTAYMDNKGRWNQVRDQYRRRHPSWVEQKQRKESKGKTSGLGITGAMTGSNASFNV